MTARRSARHRGFAEHVQALAQQVADERFVGLRHLFLGAGARPPVIIWNPTVENLRDPRLAAVMEHWRGIAPRQAPYTPDTLELGRLGAFAHYTMIVDVIGGGEDFLYRHYGRALIRHYGRDLAGTRTSAAGGHIARFSAAIYRALTIRGEPIFTEHEPPRHIFVRRWSRVLLPLVDLEGRVMQILVGSVPEDPIRAIVDTVIDGVLVVDEAGLIRIVNPAGANLLRAVTQDLVGQPVSCVLRWPDGVSSQGIPERLIGRVSDAVARCLDGREFPAEVSIGETSYDEARFLVAVIRDVTARKASEEEMRRLAYHDALTGAANRALLEERLGEALARARRDHTQLALVLLDLDDFKAINDDFGHAVGDAVLVGFARRVGAIVRETDLLARLGGDEFAVLLTGLRGSNGALTFARRLLGRLSAPLDVGGQKHRCRASVGIAIWPEDGGEAAALLQHADDALYAAKRQGGSRFVVYAASDGVRIAPPTA
jgi:diguanylate cyclase (GGDEF)-like protein/PAS domain S-box-containing protein